MTALNPRNKRSKEKLLLYKSPRIHLNIHTTCHGGISGLVKPDIWHRPSLAKPARFKPIKAHSYESKFLKAAARKIDQKDKGGVILDESKSLGLY